MSPIGIHFPARFVARYIIRHPPRRSSGEWDSATGASSAVTAVM